MNNLGNKESIKFNKYKNKLINNKCFNNITGCLALKALNTKNKKQTTKLNKRALRGHPASKACLRKKGSPIILEDTNKNQYDFCAFKDGSIIRSIDLKENK